jgi:uncharacterized protein YjiS (DUF1127 family)
MPCAGPDYSCNSLLSIRSPLGNVRVGAPVSGEPNPQRPSLIACAWIALREMIAHRRQRRTLGKLDERLLKDIGLTKAEADREADKLL